MSVNEGMLEYYFNTGKKLAKAKQRLASYPEEFYKSQTIHPGFPPTHNYAGGVMPSAS